MAYWISGSSTPFDDTLAIKSTLGLNSAGPGGIDTRPIDGFRQGIELNTVDKFFVSTQPKLWGGSIKFDGTVSHLNETRTYGDMVSFAEFFGKSQFDDKLRAFDPVLYMQLGAEYPAPLLFNNGPQQKEENTVEPLTIPFKKDTSESVGYIAHGVHGFLEEGQEDRFGRGTSPLSGFVEFGVPRITRPFLDQGEARTGDTFAGSVITPGYASMNETLVVPFTDQENEYITNQISTNGPSDPMVAAIASLKGYESSLLPYNHRSATTGTTVGGPYAAKYGTDSIAFANTMRG